MLACVSSTGFADEPVERPKVYLDKSPRIVEYQLKRLDNARLLLVETGTDDPKYLPVFDAILRRAGMSRQNREEALAGLVELRDSDSVSELISTMESMDPEEREDQRVARQLGLMLLDQPMNVLQQRIDDLQSAATSENPLLQSSGLAALMLAGKSDAAWSAATQNTASKLAWLQAVTLLPQGDLRSSERSHVVFLLNDDQDQAVRLSAIRTLSRIKTELTESFNRLADFVTQEDLRAAAVSSLLNIPHEARPADTSAEVVAFLVDFAEATPPAQRTSDPFLDAMQLADELLRRVPPQAAKTYRQRLSEVTVRLVRIHTVEEEMRYDRTYFAVEAGRPVQVILENEDLMPHNLVITKPGQLKEVALAGADLGKTPGLDGKLYVPKSPDVLFATEMVNAGQRGILTFDAPTEPGEYPYVCTFPRHWMRMYGVMIVVPDLDAWQRNPTTPADPLGNTRSFVQNWKMSDFAKEEIDQQLRGRSLLIGEKLFKDATCLGCHKMKGQGGAVGPELTDVLKRWKGDRYGILREILDPSYKIDPKYAVKVVIDVDGRTTSGIVVDETKDSISILSNPEVPEPKVISKDDIEEIVPSNVSMMPKALLDKFTKDEIFEILNYITAAGESGS